MGLAAVAPLGGCGGADDAAPRAQATTFAPTATAARPPLCGGPLRARVTGRVRSRAARELSGIVLSRARPGVLWTHNDSGDGARLLAVGTAGETIAEVTVTGAEAFDWEAIAAGPRGALLVGDIGDNAAQRASVVVYEVPEPAADAPARSTVAATARYELRYPDGARDAEALLYDRGTIVIVTKSFGGESGVYVARRPQAGAPTTLRRTGTIRLGAGGAVTAGDISADRRTIVLRTYDRAYVWRRRAGETVAAALRRRPCRADADLGAEGQGEAIALTRDGRAFITVPEGARPALRRYE